MSLIIPNLTNDAAPTESRKLLEAAEAKLGMAPNLFRALAHSPAALGSYMGLSETLGDGLLTAREREVIALATAEVNGCDYCLAAHTALGKMAGLTEAQTIGARSGGIGDDRLDALADFTRSFVTSRGHATATEIESVRAQGFTEGHLAEFVAVVAQNVLSNYFNHLAGTEIDFPKAPELQNA